MILRGLLVLARGDKAGIQEFGNSFDSFAASLAPLIAFPLVGAGVSIFGGDWQLAVLGFLARLCAVLALPLMLHEFARRLGRGEAWLRTATVLNWSFWMLVPVLLAAAFIGAAAVEAGATMQDGQILAVCVMGVFWLWYHWVIVRAGLGVSGAQAAAFVVASSLVLGLFSVAPLLLSHGVKT